uniref:Uncharacterized protein n=1 Tax=Tanacetum cinerariifolium TaxID=118510 RepID=A0A699K2T5_TANCI|nr:hypothetical protein [Tanacetum cinerariifolium]
MDCDNQKELHETLTTSRKRRRDDQDLPPPPLKDSDRNSKDIGADHLLKIKNRPDWLKPIPEEEAPKTPEPDWVIPLNDLPKPESNWADAISKSYQDPKEKKLLQKTGDMSSFIKCQSLLQEQHLLLISNGRVSPTAFFNKDLEYLVSSDKERSNALLISKLKAAYYQDFGLEELVLSLWIKSKHDYDISAAYNIFHWWFKGKEFYITRHNAPFDHRAVRSHMKILSVVSIKTFSRYGYTYLKKIALRRAEYQHYKISKVDFKNRHPNDFKDLYLLHLCGSQLNRSWAP